MLKGRYRTQEGSRLETTGKARRPKASIDALGPVPMRAMSPTKLASDDGRVALRFANLEASDCESSKLSLAAGDPLLAKAGR